MLTADVRIIAKDSTTVHGAAQIGAQAEVSMIDRDSAAMHGAAEVGAAEVGAAERSGPGRKTSSS